MLECRLLRSKSQPTSSYSASDRGQRLLGLVTQLWSSASGIDGCRVYFLGSIPMQEQHNATNNAPAPSSKAPDDIVAMPIKMKVALAIMPTFGRLRTDLLSCDSSTNLGGTSYDLVMAFRLWNQSSEADRKRHLAITSELGSTKFNLAFECYALGLSCWNTSLLSSERNRRNLCRFHGRLRVQIGRRHSSRKQA